MDKILEEVLLQIRKVWQRRWYIVPVAWLVAVAGWYYVDTLPDRYQASAEIYVNTDSVLQPLLRGMTVTPNTEQRVRMMTRTLLSRPNLEEVAREAELDLKRGSEQDLDGIVNRLSSNVQLQGGQRDNVYTIRYTSGDPQEAQQVVQTLVNMFMEGGIGAGRGDLTSSQRFIENQIERYREELDEKERELEDFKREHASLLPGDGGRNYYSRLENVEQQLEQARLELREARNRKQTYERQLEGLEPVLLDDEPGENEFRDPELESRLNALRSDLDNLRRRYTDQHPDVAQLRRMIAELEEEKAERAAQHTPQRSRQPEQSVFQQHLSLSLSEAESRVASLSTRVEEYENRRAKLREDVDRIPRIESEYASLRREKNVTESNYEQLLNRREQALMSGQVETQTDAVDFRVIDPPRVPSHPSDPNRPMLASAALILGVGAGTGLAFVLAQLRSTVTSRQKLAELTGRSVLGAVSFVDTRRSARRRRLGMAAFVLALGALVAVYAAVVASYFLL